MELNDPNSELLEAFLVEAGESLFPARPRPAKVRSRGADGDMPLHIAALRGNSAAISVLVQAGSPINAKGDMSNSPLYYAVMGKHVGASELLLELGADPDQKSELGYTPRSLAKHYGHKALIRLFSLHGPGAYGGRRRALLDRR